MDKALKDKYYELYELAYELYEIAPWNILWDNEFSCFIPKEKDKLYYASVLGKGGMFNGMVITLDKDVNRYLEILKENFNPYLLLSYQNGIMITFPPTMQLRDHEKVTPRELGIKFGDFAIKFDEYKRGYFPYEIKPERLDLLIYLLRNFNSLFKHLKNEEIKYEENKMLLRMENEDGSYNNVVVDLSLPDPKYIDIEVDEAIKSEFNKLKKNQDILEVEFLDYIPLTLGSNYQEDLKTYKLPRFYSIADFKKSKMIKFDVEMEKKSKDELDYFKNCVSDLISFIIDREYKPKQILVRDMDTFKLLESFSKVTGIDVTVSKLSVTDSFIKMALTKE